MDILSLQKQILAKGKLSGGEKYWERRASLRGMPKQTAQALRPAPGKAGVPFKLVAAGQSKTITVGQAPQGFGQGFIWDRQDPEILLVLFINAADSSGVSIDGLQPGDKLTVGSATGIASFAEDTGDPLAQSLIGLVAVGVNVGLTITGHPEAIPFINAAAKVAQDQFKAPSTNPETKHRDAFGVEPGTGLKARQEGGILVCLPEAGGPFYSGDDDHKERWIKKPGDRVDENIPSHITGAFFPIRGDTSHNTRQTRVAGQAYVVAWDAKFPDNLGFYKVFMRIKKGTLPKPPVVEIKSRSAGAGQITSGRKKVK